MTIIGNILPKIQSINESSTSQIVSKSLEKIYDSLTNFSGLEDVYLRSIYVQSESIIAKIKKYGSKLDKSNDLKLSIGVNHFNSPCINIGIGVWAPRKELVPGYKRKYQLTYRLNKDQIELIYLFIRNLVTDPEILPYFYVRETNEKRFYEPYGSVTNFGVAESEERRGYEFPLINEEFNKLPGDLKRRIKELQKEQDDYYSQHPDYSKTEKLKIN